ncbi:MAG: glycoside hydrolase family 31 protein, partial [Christensenellaceae bacterium]|nr:glycoside hydrolase family 31 protein [Christensenellaceae bacterium]
TIQEGEQWYGGRAAEGKNMPITSETVYGDSTISGYGDQGMPLYLSSKGRYIWSDCGFKISFNKGAVSCQSSRAEIKLYEGYNTLRGAFLAAHDAHFPSDGKMPDAEMFRIPQYCTWIEMYKYPSERKILNYAKSILASGMPAGELIIDDGWQADYGHWEFVKSRFRNPKRLVDELHALGFKVIMWCVPFVNKKVPDYKFLEENDLLVKNADGTTAFRRWWDGVSAELDLTNPKAVGYFLGVASGLIKKYGVDGFKQDAADCRFYKEDDITYASRESAAKNGGRSDSGDPNTQAEEWVNTGLEFRFNEFRASWKGAGKGVAERLGDKRNVWDEGNGLRSLIPNILTLGITGHPFACPDMVGGGLSSSFNFRPEFTFDKELFVRWCQASSYMPMVQFSYALWNLRDKTTAKRCIKAVLEHLNISDYLVKCAEESARTGEPIVRYTEYNYPEAAGVCETRKQFMVGDKYIVAPILYKNQTAREVYLPKGKWLCVPTNTVVEGNNSPVEFAADIETLLVFALVS